MRHSAAYRGAGKIEITASGQIRRVGYLPETTRSAGRHSVGIRGRRERHNASLAQGTCLGQGKAFGGSQRTFRSSTRNWRTGLQLIARRGVKCLNKVVGLARHESSLSRTVRSFAPNSHRFVGHPEPVGS